MINHVRYVFCYSSSTIGGTQLLFARIAEALIKDGIRVLIVEQNRSFINNYLNERKLEFEAVRVSESNHFTTTAGDLLVLSLSDIFLFRQFIDAEPEARLVFWDLHPFALIETSAFSKIYKAFPDSWLSSLARLVEKRFRNKINIFITEASNKKSLYFMCLRNFITNKEFFGLNFTPTYLPIPIHVNENKNLNAKGLINSSKTLKPHTLNIAWISRMDAGKLKVLGLLLEDVMKFNAMHDDVKILIHAIGIESTFKRVRNTKGRFGDVLRLPGILWGVDLDSYVAKNIDIGFSSGTAALEFASRRIPTVLVPSYTWYKLFKKEGRI